jgi:hypothetical protein
LTKNNFILKYLSLKNKEKLMPKVYNLPPDFTPKVGTKIELSEDHLPDSNKKISIRGKLDTQSSILAEYLIDGKIVLHLIIKKDEENDQFIITDII